jgi:hypothetical protein
MKLNCHGIGCSEFQESFMVERERERESDEGEWLLLYPGDDDKVAWSQGDAL